MISKEEVKRMVDAVCFATEQTQEELAVAMGYGKTYISEIFSPKGKVTEKFVRNLRMYYLARPGKPALENPNLQPLLHGSFYSGTRIPIQNETKKGDQQQKSNSEKLDQSDRELLLEILINQKATLQYLREIQNRLAPIVPEAKGSAAISEVKEMIKKGKLAGKGKQSNRDEA